MMKRVLEPEIMDDEAQALAYAKADFSSSNQTFVEMLLEDYGVMLRSVLDIGCGPGDIPIRLARAKPSITITALDASEPMVRLAREAVRSAGLQRQIKVIKARVPGLELGAGDYDAIVSKDLLHHLPEPAVLWEEIRRLARKRTAVYVMDLFRPPTQRRAQEIVESVSGGESPLLKHDFYASLRAAFTIDEIRKQLRQASLSLDVEQVSERHVLVKGLI
ncbi:MAG: class I SAM-dependent methyltransferase [Phycisphaerales bacterium]|nr:MAG: class I SAM-dependent methyltransferase [Phycisphaerales bacterium]